jgi:hypothetical protein
MRHKPWFVGLLILGLGCGAESANKEYFASAAASAAVGAAPADEEAPAQEAQPEQAAQVLQERKIIYTANIGLVVEDFAAAETDIPKLIAQFGGYLANVSVDRTRGSYLTANYTVRVPTERYADLLAALETLGMVESQTQSTQEVTEEYVDLQSRISSKQQLEQRILKLLEDRNDAIEKVLQVERELARVREEIEQMQGRLRFLANRVALATIVINVREERDYEPPQEPTFASRIGRAWDDSIGSLIDVGQSTVVTLVFLAPWLVLLLPIPVLLAWLARRRFRLGRASGGS